MPILLLLAGLSVAFSLRSAEWAPGLDMLPWLVVGSVVLGVILARSVLPPWVLHLSSASIGFVVTVLASAHYFLPNAPLGDAVNVVLLRMGQWVDAVWEGQFVEDPLPFSFLLGFVLWLSFHLSVWLIYYAGKVWWAVVAPSIALLVNTYYSPQAGSGYVLIYAFCALLLIIRVSVLELEHDWRLARIPHDRTLVDDFLVDAACIVAVLIVLAWLVPPLSLEQQAAGLWVRFERPWRSVQQKWTEVFAVSGGVGSPRLTVYGESLVMGGPVHLADDPLFEVRASKSVRMQGMVYDLYDGRQWWSTGSGIALVEPDQFPIAEVFQERVFVEQSVTVLRETRSLLAAPAPKWFSIPVKSEHVTLPVERGLSQLDVYAATARETLGVGDRYTALSAVAEVSKDELRAAGQAYPEWLSGAYLSLPSALPARVSSLAAEIAKDAANPYDAAEALEGYLRTLSYSQEVQPPPPDRDAVDYFLFDSQEGYCNYFASAMVVMARSLGIPARVAAGYAPGHYDSEREAYILLGSDAHSWPQLFFPGYGWIDFEPTPSQSLVVRPQSFQSDEEGEPAGRERDSYGPDRSYEDGLDLYGGYGEWGPIDLTAGGGAGVWPLALLAGLVGLGVALVVWWVLPRRGWDVAERLYANLVAISRLLGIRPRHSETPLEYGARIAAVIPEAASPVQGLVDGFCDARYGGLSADEDGTRLLQQQWREVLSVVRRALPRRIGARVQSLVG